MRPVEPVARRHLRIPRAEPGLVVGLFGGSFNPPHAGHRLVAEIAVRRLGLDQLWWMVTPGNPLKDHGELAPLPERIALSEALTHDRRIRVSAFEAAWTLNFSAETIALVQARNRGVRFVWVMGADSLASFHRWQNWQEIVRRLPIAVIDRPGSTLSFLSAKLAKTFGNARVDEEDAGALARMRPPAWTFIHGPRSSLSSTELRRTRSGRAGHSEA
ncbi:nicotinate-nucleotide adenylyltransferase [Pararhizobium mangrovi]|uniref:Probable nicotinate-nucleotide adenylyltransferase n=1 Tax=Pararhizobium mangrovi TaxID=2590452 RepID=A0A506TWV4_9HYPH|nr:nicotinate-nucleotide adenylyltransferase [Pararhizobium mangrovi]